jgi:uncharacterized protein
MSDLENKLPRITNFAVLAAAFEGGLAILALCLGWWMGEPPMASFHWSVADLGWGLAATIPPLAVLAACILVPWRPLRRIVQLLDQSILPLFRECRLFEIAVISLLAGLGEEMLFRSIIQDGIARDFSAPYGAIIGLVAAAVIFGLLHSMTLAYAILAAIIGLYMGVIWLLSDNLLVPITAHALYDFLAIVVLLRIQKPAKAADDQTEAESNDE